MTSFFSLNLFQASNLGSFRAFSILFPLLLLRPEFSLPPSWNKCVHKCNDSKTFPHWLRCGLHDLFEKLVPCAALWIHEIPLFKRALSLKSCRVLEVLLQFPESSNDLDFSFCAAWLLPSRCPTFSSHFWWFLDILCLPDQSNKFLSVCAQFSSFGSSFAHVLPFSSLRCFTEIGPYFWPHVIQSRSRLNF